ncbi:hypothetical protein E9993_04050 [Labilibacter sediminis]|nr:hypothetical protein E9993_04050 [Labilibacter sediminis]
MLKYIFTSILFLAIGFSSFGQDYTQPSGQNRNGNNQQRPEDEEGTPRQKKEKLPYPNKKRGTSFGVDITQFFVPVFDDDRIVAEANIRTNFKKRMFLTGSLGYEKISFDDKSYHYDSDGVFARVGIDYDIFIVDEPDNNDNILIGLRYGMAIQDHGSDLITIEDGYWGNYETSIDNYSLNSHWVELVAGLRSEVLKNLYFSWFIRVKGKIHSNNTEVLEPYRIPGYGKGANAINLGFSYNVAYQIPWGNKNRKAPTP